MLAILTCLLTGVTAASPYVAKENVAKSQLVRTLRQPHPRTNVDTALVERLESTSNASNSSTDVTASYDQNFCNRTLMFAYGAYCDKSNLEAWNCKWCEYVPNFQTDIVVELDQLQAFTGYDVSKSQVVVSFRGTHNIWDWFDDIDMIYTDYPGVDGGKVHKGFYNAWQDLKPDIMASAEKLMDQYKGKQVLMTGHSLGAAVAQLAALELKDYARSTGNSAHFLSQHFGSPRWCNSVMSAYYEQNIDTNWRIVNVHDIVPTMPFGFDYHHGATEIHYTSDSPLKYEQCDGSGEDSSCGYTFASANDHLMYMNLYETCK